jgi:putative ABC transport system substrate-binding protein
MQRREFIALLGGAAAWPAVAQAQPGERLKRVGVLMTSAAEDPQSADRISAFSQGLRKLDWVDGRNVRLDIRWGAADPGRYRSNVDELITQRPDVILAVGAFIVELVLQATRTVPVVFTQVIDPVGNGFVQSLARPGGNATGFTRFDYALSAKWLELLKQLVPHVTEVAVIRDPLHANGIGQWAAVQSVAPSFGVELRAVNVRDPTEIERVLTAIGRSPNGGLVVTEGAAAILDRDLIIKLATMLKLPAVFSDRLFVASGGLLSYGPNSIDPFRSAAGYVDRILKGEKPADLPVQTPTKYDLAINLKAAKEMGLTIPPSVLARADEVIE